MFSSSRFDANKCKVNLKMLLNRFNLLTQKKSNLAKQQKRQVAMLLRDDKEANARILVEHIIREDYMLESYEILKQYAELLTARYNVLVTEAELRPEISEAVCALLYAGWLMGSDVPELHQLHLLFTAKYGKPYAKEVIDHKEMYLNERLLRMLTSTQIPDPSVVVMYLTEIAKAYGVEWIPKETPTVPVSSTIGISLPMPGMPIGSANPAAPTQQLPIPGAPSLNPPNASAPAAPVPPPAVPAVPTAAAPGVYVAQGKVMEAEKSNAPIIFQVQLIKSLQGFGMILDSGNVVTSIKPDSEASRCGLLQAGDLIIALNGTKVSEDVPVCNYAIIKY